MVCPSDIAKAFLVENGNGHVAVVVNGPINPPTYHTPEVSPLLVELEMVTVVMLELLEMSPTNPPTRQSLPMTFPLLTQSSNEITFGCFKLLQIQ